MRGAPEDNIDVGTQTSMLTKVPQVALLFWVVKVLTTGMGETTSDYLAHTIGPVVAVPLGGLALAGALWLQLTRRGTPHGRTGPQSPWSACSGRWPRTCCT